MTIIIITAILGWVYIGISLFELRCLKRYLEYKQGKRTLTPKEIELAEYIYQRSGE